MEQKSPSPGKVENAPLWVVELVVMAADADQARLRVDVNPRVGFIHQVRRAKVEVLP